MISVSINICTDYVCFRVACRPPVCFTTITTTTTPGVKGNTMASEGTPLKIFSIVSNMYSFYHPVLAAESHPTPLELHDHVAVSINKGHLINPCRVGHVTCSFIFKGWRGRMRYLFDTSTSPQEQEATCTICTCLFAVEI